MASAGGSIPVGDYLVGKVLYTEKKVLEAINKLNYIKTVLLKSGRTSNEPALEPTTVDGELLS